jgi:hypothetical protein
LFKNDKISEILTFILFILRSCFKNESIKGIGYLPLLLFDMKTLILEKKFEIIFSCSIPGVFISEKNT